MNCDPIARWYRWLEYASFGPFLWRCRCAYLKDMRQARRILMVGEGDGRFLQALLKCNKQARIDYLDNSQRMTVLAQSRVGKEDSGRVQFFCIDILAWAIPIETYDLLITHYVLDCFSPPELAAVIAKIATGARPDAMWVISEFQIPKYSPLRFLMSGLISLMYRWFRWTTNLQPQQLPAYEGFMKRHGFRCVKRSNSLHGFLTSQQWNFHRNHSTKAED